MLRCVAVAEISRRGNCGDPRCPGLWTWPDRRGRCTGGVRTHEARTQEARTQVARTQVARGRAWSLDQGRAGMGTEVRSKLLTRSRKSESRFMEPGFALFLFV